MRKLSLTLAVLGLVAMPWGSVRAGVTDALVGYWNLDTNVTDQTGNGHNGTLVGTTSYVAGFPGFGQALSLADNPSSGYMIIGGPESDFDFATAATDNWSASLWLQVSGTWNDSWEALLNKGEGNAWRLHRWSGSAGLNAITPSSLSTGTDVQDGQWHHLAVTRSDRVTRLYLDGVIAAQAATPGTPGNNGNSPRLGSNTQASGREFGGQLDEVGIWSRSLGVAEVRGLYNHGAGATVPTAQVNAAESIWDFADPSVAGWTVEAGGVATRADLGKYGRVAANAAGGEAHDGAHPTMLLSSPHFRFNGGTLGPGDDDILRLTLFGGMGNQSGQSFTSPADVLGFNGGQSAADGAKGVGLLDLLSGEYETILYAPNNGFSGMVSVTTSDFAGLGLSLSRSYRLDFFDNDHGGWGWGGLALVELAGFTVPEPSSVGLLALGCFGLLLRLRRRR